ILPYINNGKIYYVPVKTQITKELFEFPGIYPDEADFWHGRYLSGNDHFFEVFLNPRRVKSSIILYIYTYTHIIKKDVLLMYKNILLPYDFGNSFSNVPDELVKLTGQNEDAVITIFNVISETEQADN